MTDEVLIISLIVLGVVVGFVLGIFGVIGSLTGLKISMEYLSGDLHRRLFAILLILISIYYQL